MSIQPRRRLAGTRTPTTQVSQKTIDARRAAALRASIAATKKRNEGRPVVDWDAVIARFKTDMADRYGTDPENTTEGTPE